MNVVIRVDASPQIGTGHVVRCLTLADALRADGAAVRFVCRRVPDALAALVREHGHELVVLPAAPEGGWTPAADAPAHAAWLGVGQERDAADTAAALAAGGRCDWLVVDHYALDARWEGALRALAGAILVIDDLADRRHDCDVLLDQNHYENMAQRYDGLLPARCARLLGSRYALLRDEFRALRAGLAPRDGAVRRVLVFFGGVDAGNATGAVLEALAQLAPGQVELDVVIGAGHPARAQIEARCQALAARCHVQTPHMARLMAAADLAIGAGGTATWERCALGLPALVFSLAENQRLQVRDGARAGLVYAPELAPDQRDGVLTHLRALLDNAALRNLLSRNGMQAVDGRGVGRVARQLAAGAIEVRRAGAADSADLLAWRNDAAVRAVSHHSAPIAPEAHQRWLAGVLADPRRQLLIGSRGGRPVGVVRFDLDGEHADISIYLAPDAHGRGDGGALLLAAERWLRRAQPQVTTLRAEVLRDNLPSHRLFANGGYLVHNTYYAKKISS